MIKINTLEYIARFAAVPMIVLGRTARNAGMGLCDYLFSLSDLQQIAERVKEEAGYAPLDTHRMNETGELARELNGYPRNR